MNRAFLIGRLTKDPELRQTSSGLAVTNFTLAVSRPFTGQNGEREADFLNIIVWRKSAENVKKYLNKGSQCAVEGRIQTRTYQSKEGDTRYVTEVVADRVEFLESKSQAQSRNQSNNSQNYSPQAPAQPKSSGMNIEEDPFASFGNNIEMNNVASDDDLPF